MEKSNKRFHKGDTVIYGSAGICQVEEVSRQSFLGEEREYYVLCSLCTNGERVFVPVDNPALTDRMFPTLTKEQIDTLLSTLPSTAPVWIESDDARKNRFAEILVSGDRAALLMMIHSLYNHRERQEKKGKKLHMADERSFREGEKLLYGEFAHVLKMQPEDVPDYIRKRVGS